MKHSNELSNRQNQLLEIIGKNIRSRRTKKHLSQSDLAKQADLSVNTIVKIENVENKDMSLMSLYKIANYLGCSIGDLLVAPISGNNEQIKRLEENIKNECGHQQHFLKFMLHMIKQVKKLQEEDERQKKIKSKAS
ncbi:MAG: helix-turn-helix transcriptional regulator [Alphaproteobacteria bacterium]|nr:helix-turn-helix transcriptional regulator [Alphaproteobacteria bacterium]